VYYSVNSVQQYHRFISCKSVLHRELVVKKATFCGVVWMVCGIVIFDQYLAVCLK